MQLLRLRTVFASVLLVLAMTGLSLLSPSAATAAPAAPADLGTITSTVTGTYTDATGAVGTFTGTFMPSEFTVDGDRMSATGALAGQLVGADGTTQQVSQTQTFAVSNISAVGCQVLDLTLAPLDLDLLGLTVHLDRVHLNITAVPGPGNLLGNLICAIAGLLDGGPLGQIAALLNQILALLRG